MKTITDYNFSITGLMVVVFGRFIYYLLTNLFIYFQFTIRFDGLDFSKNLGPSNRDASPV